MIAALSRVLGLNSIIVYALGLLLLVGGVWFYGGYKYYQGKVEGIHSEQLKRPKHFPYRNVPMRPRPNLRSKSMQLKRLLLVASLLSLSGCLTPSTRLVVEPLPVAKIPALLRLACQGVVDVPSRDLTLSDVARLWGKDRSALGECARRHEALSKSVDALEGQGK